MKSQKEYVRELLVERGEKGVSAHELMYTVKPGITRLAAVIFDLRRSGMNIDTVNEPGKQAVYIYRGGTIKPEPPPIPDQTEMFSEEEIPGVTWEQLREKVKSW